MRGHAALHRRVQTVHTFFLPTEQCSTYNPLANCLCLATHVWVASTQGRAI